MRLSGGGVANPSVTDVFNGTGDRLLTVLAGGDGPADPRGGTSPVEAAGSYVDLLRLYLQTGDPLYRRLFAATLKSRFRAESASPEQRREEAARAVAQLRARALDTLREGPSSGVVDRAASFFDEVEQSVTTTGGKPFRVLLIGDGLFQDILSTLEEECLEDGLQLQTSFIDAQEPQRARQQVIDRQAKFDAVFYSPLSYEQAAPFRQVLEWRNATLSGAAFQEMIGQTLHEIDVMLGLLTAHRECPIFVHNTVAVRRHEGGPKDLLKNAVTLPLRRRARDEVNAGIEALLAQHGAASGRPLGLIDETRLLAQDTDEELGRTLNWSPLHRPAVLGVRLASIYRDRIYVAAHLLGRKVVVADLDNTLWHGVTGEGAIRHDVGRQSTLRRLRDRGVLLAVNSKNDPGLVQWKGAVLDPEDFVHAEINWDHKAENMRRIQQALNLRFDDFVFVDDEADQRELVRLAVPQIHPLDAGDQRCWRLLGTWADMLGANTDTDRTALYRQREQRQRFVDAQVSVEDPRELFSRLDIHVHIRGADRDDLPRAAELINRTNQFNTCGSRTTVQELAAWRAASNRHVLLVDASDKFGSNGTVAVMLLETSPDEITIPCFVLSCRVFGFGIEHAVINHVKRTYRRHEGQPIVGHMTTTAHNRPCREVYRHNGFTWNGEHWVYRERNEPVDPQWLTVHAPRETRRLYATS